LIGQLPDLLPGEGIADPSDATGIDEEGGRISVFLQYGKGIGVYGGVAIVDGDHHGPWGRR